MIIGLTGPYLAGKSTIAKALWDHHDFIQGHFTQKGKEVIADIYDLSYEQLYGSAKEIIDPRYNLTPRFIMENFMTNVCRNIFDDTWVYCLERKWIALDRPNMVIDDLRFPNEAAWIAQHAGMIIEVRRNGCEYTSVPANAGLAAPFAAIAIENNGSIEDLMKGLELFIKGLV